MQNCQVRAAVEVHPWMRTTVGADDCGPLSQTQGCPRPGTVTRLPWGRNRPYEAPVIVIALTVGGPEGNGADVGSRRSANDAAGSVEVS
jgi:hypothetical protein